MDFKSRIDRVVSGLQEQGIDAYFAHSATAMGYLQGFGEDPHERFTTLAISATGQVRLICPALSMAQVEKLNIPEVVSWRDGEDPVALFETLAADWNLKSAVLAVEPSLPAHMLLKMQSTLPAALFKDGETVLGPVMAQKTPDELDLLKRAGRIADDAFLEVLPQLKPGLTEKEVATLLKDAMAARGGIPTFDIIAAGPSGAAGHHLTSDTVIQAGDVVVLDFGCELEGYQSDITRTVCFGKASDKAKLVYDLVYRAHMAGRDSIKPGISGEGVDRATRQVIVDGGYGPFFVHRTGHGIGMNGHEPPYIVEGNTTPLDAGNSFSIEPGIYLSGEFGIRIENIVACTADGHISMNDEPSSTLIELEF